MRADAMRTKFRQSFVLALGILMLAFCAGRLRVSAQEVTATINGTVTDASGKVVAGASVIATDLDRGTAWPTTTNGSGFYNLAHLPIGRYEVRVTVVGFRTAVQSPIAGHS